jgi:hypothetical protein
MSFTRNHSRALSVILLLSALLTHGVFQMPDSGAGLQTSGLLRLGRDLMRRTGAADVEGAPVRESLLRL